MEPQHEVTRLLSDLQMREPSVVSLWRLGDPAGSTTAREAINQQRLTVGAPAALGSPGCLCGESSTMATSSGTGSLTVSGNSIIPFIAGNTWTIEAMTCSEPSGNSFTIANIGSSVALEVVSGSQLRLTVIPTSTALSVTAALTGGPDLVQATSDGAYLRLYVNGVRAGSLAYAAPVLVATVGQTIRVLSGPVTFSQGAAPWAAIGQNVALYAAALGAMRCSNHFAAARQINTDRRHVSTFAPLAIL